MFINVKIWNQKIKLKFFTNEDKLEEFIIG